MSRPIPSATDATPLEALLRRRAHDLHDLVSRAAVQGDVEVIHAARVTTRRLKAALDLLAPALPRNKRKRFARSLRRLRRSLGPLRDVDVMTAHLERLGRRPALSAAAGWLAARLGRQRLALMKDAARRKRGKDLAESQAAWAELAPAVRLSGPAARALLEQAALQQLDDFSGRADHLAAAARGGPTSDVPGDVHELRIAGKLLRYTLELAGPTGHVVPKGVLRTFKKLQHALGGWHDFVVLGEQALRAALEEQVPRRDPALYGGLLDLARACWRRSERYLRHFVTLWTQCGPALRRDLAAAVANWDAHDADGAPLSTDVAEAGAAGADDAAVAAMTTTNDAPERPPDAERVPHTAGDEPDGPT